MVDCRRGLVASVCVLECGTHDDICSLHIHVFLPENLNSHRHRDRLAVQTKGAHFRVCFGLHRVSPPCIPAVLPEKVMTPSMTTFPSA